MHVILSIKTGIKFRETPLCNKYKNVQSMANYDFVIGLAFCIAILVMWLYHDVFICLDPSGQ